MYAPELHKAEHVICNLGVVGSNPTRGSSLQARRDGKILKLLRVVTRVAKWGRL